MTETTHLAIVEVVEANYIGTDTSGTVARGNQYGISIYDSSNNVIGGTASGAGNVISGNTNDGVLIYGTTSEQNVVDGNLIGTTASGLQDLGNTDDGVYVFGVDSNSIGATVGNVISGNNGDGVKLSGASYTTVTRNLIGTDRTGTAAIGNDGNGVSIYSQGTNNVIGSESGMGSGNVISGNKGEGVRLANAGTTSLSLPDILDQIRHPPVDAET